MKISAVRIRNFKLLKRIDIEFSVEKSKPLTVIRAENGSGKTSMLQALRWALYGNDVLEDQFVRLSPADWTDGSECEILVEIDFIHTALSNVNGEHMLSQTDYMLKRKVVECPEGDHPNRGQERVTLFEKTNAGSDLIDSPEFRLTQMLPKEMIDIFFTDGDAAMSFISPRLSENTKRDKVKEAIRSLLGLDLLEKVEKRFSLAQSVVNRLIAKNASSDRLTKITEEIETKNKEKKELVESVNTLKIQIDDSGRRLESVEKELAKALEAGSYEQLVRQKEIYQKQLQAATEEEEKYKKFHQELFQHEYLSWGLLESVLENGFSHLQELHAKGVIPKYAVPVLEERLELKKCICGADLTKGTEAHESVCELIEQNRQNDNESEYLSSLYHQAKQAHSERESKECEKWQNLVTNLQQQRISINHRIDVANRELKSIEAKIDQINEKEIEDKQSHRKMLMSTLSKKNTELTRKEANLKEITQQINEKIQVQTELRRADKKIEMYNAEKTVLNDLQYIVEGSLGEMHGTYLRKVSERMNELFLFMVGADPEQGATFQGVEIKDNYSIVVKTTDNRTLNPDYEVNGASQRALTFAFIWALTEVSSVVAPRVIDTPLGMMSGNVKRRVLGVIGQSTTEEVDKQVVLFLTQSEISHTEDILDKHVGAISTLVKTDDFPADLMNDPNSGQSEIKICGCSHRQYCDQCQRTNFNNFDLTYRST